MSQKEISMLRQWRQICLLKSIGLEKVSGSLLCWMEKKFCAHVLVVKSCCCCKGITLLKNTTKRGDTSLRTLLWVLLVEQRLGQVGPEGPVRLNQSVSL